jgi:hypothetical protein
MTRSLTFFLLFLSCSLPTGTAVAQGNIADSSLSIKTVAPSYAFHLPAGDMKERFGPSSNIGLRAGIKTSSKFQFDLVGSFIFGNRVKNTDQLLRSLKTSRGRVLDSKGEPAIVQYLERGFSVSLQAGRVFPIFGYNPNSGILIKVGGGFLQHNIRYETEKREVPQLGDDRKKYFDRRVSGFTFHEFVGYQHLANNGVANFFIGLDLFQAFPKNRRSYNVDKMKAMDEDRTDLLYGIRAGYILSIYESESQERFYY